MNNRETEEARTVIHANRPWWRIPVGEILAYRGLLYQLVRRDFVSRYKQTILGPAWFILQPLAMTAVFTLVFHRIARIPTDGIPPPLFYMAGLLTWNFFSNSFTQVGGTFRNNANVFGKVYFPRLISPLASIVTQGFAFGLQLLTFTALFLYFRFVLGAEGFHLSNGAVLFPLLLLQIVLLGLGVGLWITSLTAKYRDLVHALGFLTQIWMYLTPVIYPLSRIPEEIRWLAVFNPMAGPVETTRWMLLGEGTLPIFLLVGNLLLTVGIFLSGLFLFSRVERTFIDTV